ncbi:thioredoxin [Weissella halotolerans]|uniref:Thioredoxin n=1 Tax=Weissella halotolerans DSM 20190 TaxID=1123500 RepID=A0A0R2FZL7_9LACO|nr:thioredoxin [Weissella halotolerans]KRN33664.1 thiol-disulfide isomerase and thioredoxin [Weissella halotolerans DSM 20190]
MAVKEITDQDFANETATGVTLTDFWAPWCGPCRMQSPVVEQLASERTDVTFLKMDVDQNPATAQELKIMAIPTLLIKKDGQVVERLTGYTPAAELNKLLDTFTA